MPTEIENQKQKLFLKTLTEEATDIITKRMYQIGEVLNFDMIWLSLMDLLTALTLVADFGFGLTDFDIFHLEFDFQLPSIDELLKGLYTIVIELNLEDVFSKFLDFEFGIEYDPSILLDYLITLEYFFKIDTYWGIGYGRIPIGRYGIDKYCLCIYYTPFYPPKFLPSMPSNVGNQMIDLIPQSSVNPQVLAQLVALGIDPRLVKALLRKIDWFEKALEKGFFLGVNLLGYSEFAPKTYYSGKEGAKIELEPGYEAFVPNIDMLCYGFILGISLLGLDRFVVTNTTVFRDIGPRFAYYRAMRVKRRFVSPISGLLFRKTWREMQSVHKHRASLKYGTHRHFIDLIRRQVKGRIRNRVKDAFTQNVYVMAVLDLVYRKRVGHQRSKLWKTILSDEDFKNLWIEKWVAQGLNREILLELYEAFKPCQKVAEKL